MITVIRDTTGAMRQHVHIGHHLVTVDESAAGGGDDSGPTPHDLFDAALGACNALTVVWYAKRKGIPVAEVRVDVERDATDERAGTYRLHTTLTLGGTLTDDQRGELLRVAGKCPIHKLMTEATIEITTVFADA